MTTRNLFWKGAALLGGAGLVLSTAVAVAQSASTGTASPPPQPAAATGRLADAAGSPAAADANGAEAAQSRNAARSRMRECGHQWSTMKKNGTASGMTWKDFSQGCLAKQ